MEKQELNLDSHVFKNTIEQQNFIDILATLDHITPKFISREEFNNRKGNVLVKTGKDSYGDQHQLYIAEDIKLLEFPAIIKRVTEIVYKDKLPPQSSVNELKYKIEVAYDILREKLKLSHKKDKSVWNLNKDETKEKTKKIEKAINKYYTLYIDLGGEPKELHNSGNRKKRHESYENSNFLTHYNEFSSKKINKRTSSSLQRLELSISKEIMNHTDEVFFEKGVNMLYEGLETFTQANFQKTEEKKKNLTNKKNKIIVKNIKKNGLDSQSRKLRNKLSINRYKKKLFYAREKNEPAQIEKLELEIVRKLLLTLRTEYPYQLTQENDGYQPSKILQSKELYCVGFSLVGHAFMSELGIKHNGMNIPNHSALEVIIGEKKYYFDGANSGYLGELHKKNTSKGTNTISYKVANTKGKIIHENIATIGNTETILLSQIYNNRANKDFRNGRYQQALQMYNKALSKDPTSSTFLSNKANTLRKIGKKREAQKTVKKSLHYNPNNAHAYYVEGAMLKGHFAIDAFNTSLKINPITKYAYKEVGKKLQKMGDKYNATLYTYVYQLMEGKGVTLNSIETKKQREKILKLYKQNKLKEIQELLAKSVSDKKSLDAGKKLFGEQKYNHAIMEFKKVSKKSRYLAETYEYQGLSLTKQVANKLALTAYYNALNTGTKSKVIHYNISKILQSEGRSEEAQIYEFVDYLINPNNPEYIGKSFKGLKERKEIVRLYSQSRNLHGINKFLVKQYNF